MKIEAPSPHRSTSPAVTQGHQPPYPTLLGYALCGVLSGDRLLPLGTGFPCKEGGKVLCNVTGAWSDELFRLDHSSVAKRDSAPSQWNAAYCSSDKRRDVGMEDHHL